MGLFGSIASGIGGTLGGLPGAIAGGSAADAIGGGNPNDPLSYLAGRPKSPSYIAPGAFTSAQAANVQFDPVNRAALDKLSSIGMSDAESPWATLQRQKLATEQGAAADQLRANMNQDFGRSVAALGAKGALTGGAMERLGKIAGDSYQEQLQKLGGKGVGASQDIALKDYENRLGILKALPQAELQYAEPGMKERLANAGYTQQANLANAAGQNQYNLTTHGRENEFAQGKYGQDLSAWANMANAQAMAANRPKGFFESMMPWNWG